MVACDTLVAFIGSVNPLFPFVIALNINKMRSSWWSWDVSLQIKDPCYCLFFVKGNINFGIHYLNFFWNTNMLIFDLEMLFWVTFLYYKNIKCYSFFYKFQILYLRVFFTMLIHSDSPNSINLSFKNNFKAKVN